MAIGDILGGSFTTTSVKTNSIKAAFDRMARMELNSMPLFRQIVDVRPTAQDTPGTPINFTINDWLDAAVTPLTEGADIDAVARPNPRRVAVTPAEYGNAVTNTHKLVSLQFLKTPEGQQAALEVAENMGNSLDELVQAVLATATNKLAVTAVTAGVSTLDTSYVANDVLGTSRLTGAAVSAARTLLLRRNVPFRQGSKYVAYIHPDVAHDLRREAGPATWLEPREQVDTSDIYSGATGDYAGVRFIESVRCINANNTAGTPVRVYNSYVVGREALVEASVDSPRTFIAPQVDKAGRFTSLGWYAFLGWNIFRQESIELVQTGSSMSAL